jgi:hypothetical protein
LLRASVRNSLEAQKRDVPEIENRRVGQSQVTETPAQDTRELFFKAPTIQLDVLRRPQATFVPLQEWEGYVVGVTKSHVLANLVDLTNNAVRPDEQVEIPLQEFSDQDVTKLSVGKVFRWAVGYQHLPTGTKMRISQIIVRNLPQWSRREIAEAKSEAQDLHKLLNRD